jgi:hypothetical protein
MELLARNRLNNFAASLNKIIFAMYYRAVLGKEIACPSKIQTIQKKLIMQQGIYFKN